MPSIVCLVASLILFGLSAGCDLSSRDENDRNRLQGVLASINYNTVGTGLFVLGIIMLFQGK